MRHVHRTVTFQSGDYLTMIFTVATLLLTFVCALSASADDLPPGVVDTQNPQDVSLSPEASLGRITVPDGFHVTLYAGEPDVRRPVAFDFDDRGRLWVVENYSHPNWREDGASDRIVILEDTDHDGRFDRRKVFWDKGRYLTGIAIGHGGVWIANTPELAFLPDRDADDVPDTDPVVILDGFQISTSNVLNNLHWGPDGWLYGAIGLSEPSRVGRPGTPQEKRTRITRGMWRCHPIRHDFEVLAEGMVNPWGADFNAYGDLFTVNTVIAHLWHIVPGMYCQRRGDEQDYPFAYGRIQSIANHLHWGGGRWQDSGTNADRHSVAGGGHAHCGAMIYLGDNWPKKYHGTLFTANLHGNRLNNDLLIPNQSTYVGAHADDFLFGNDPWFRGLSVKYGPDGGVYISDWHDLGECHDKDGSHRSSGRIYKVVYGRPEKRSVDLQRLSDGALAELHLHANAWFVRHARRILHERFHSGRDLVAARRRLREIFRGDRDEVHRLRALWTLYVIGGLDEPTLVRLLRHENHHVRRWAVRLLVDRHPPGSEALDAMAHLAREDASPEVRLALASSLHKLQLKDRWAIGGALAAHGADARDPYLPLMIWYGVEPLVAEDSQAALILASTAKIPLLRRYIARRLLDVAEPAPEQVVRAALRTPDPHVRFDFLQGMLDALGDRGSRSPPPSWQSLHEQITASSDPALRSVAVRLATLFGDRQAIARLQKNALDDTASPRERRESLRALLQVDGGVPVSMLHRLVEKKSVVRRDAIHALVLRNDPSTAKVLLDAYSDLDLAQQQDAISVLGTRRRFAAALLDAIEQGTVQRGDVSAYALQQLRSFHDAELQRRVGALWADHADQLVKSDEIARYKQRMTSKYLQRGEVGAGRLLFERTCAKCHMLFGEGGTIAPDLTGSARQELDYLLSNLVDPSAIVDPVYRLTIIATSDGRVLSGFMIQQTERFVVLRTQEARVRLAMEDIEDLQTSSKSMMPEGMLRSLSDEQVRDLLLYLSSPQQVPLPRSNDDT